MNKKALHLGSILIIVFFALLQFQNCGTHRFSAEKSASSLDGNGWAYEGKIYVSVETCPDVTPVAKLQLFGPNTAILLKESCAILSIPSPVAVGDLRYDSNRPDEIFYKGRHFVAEVPSQHQISFIHNSTLWNNVSANSMTGAAMPGATTAGNLLICSVLYNSPNGVAEISSMTDNLGNSFVRAVGPLSQARREGYAGYTSEVWYVENSRGGSGQKTTASFSEPMPSNQGMNCWEYSGIVSANSLDHVSTYLVFGGPGSIQTTPFTTRWSSELVFMAHWGFLDSRPSSLTDRVDFQDSGLDMFLSSVQQLMFNFTTTSSVTLSILSFRGK